MSYNPQDLQAGFWIGDCHVEPRQNRIVRGTQETRLERRVMDVLVCLAEHAGEVVSRDALSQKVSDLKSAIALLGLREIRNLAMTVFVSRLYDGGSGHGSGRGSAGAFRELPPRLVWTCSTTGNNLNLV